MKKWVRTIHERLIKEQPLVMALILSHEGSTPRSAGTRMLLGADGAFVGTIGGGRIEADVMDIARQMLGKPGAVVRSFDLTSELTDAMDMICGGKMQILVESILPDNTSRMFFSSLREKLEHHQQGYLITEIQNTASDMPGIRHAFWLRDGTVIGEAEMQTAIGTLPEKLNAPLWIEASDRRFYIEPVLAAGTVSLFGAGHVSLHTAALAKSVGFDVVVLDDRAEFANRHRFPNADDVRVLASFDQAMEGLFVCADSYLVILTRGHLHDKTVLQQALKTPAGYIGMIGSRKKRDAIYRALENEGFSADDFARVHCPIGLSIGAQTPEEIAVSIVAELIHARSRN